MTMLPVLPKLTERAFERQVIQYAEMVGWHVWKDRATNAPRACAECGAPLPIPRNAAGWPDLVLIRRPRLVFAELKSDRGKLTEAQLAAFCELRHCNQEVYVWRPRNWPKIERILR